MADISSEDLIFSIETNHLTEIQISVAAWAEIPNTSL